jgi:uncharacterized protein (DUF4415 family)
MAEAGKLYHNPDAPTDIEALGADFWKGAQVVPAKEAPHSVHLKLDPEVFDFFKRQGKGHLTKMQNVLRAYMRAQVSK